MLTHYLLFLMVLSFLNVHAGEIFDKDVVCFSTVGSYNRALMQQAAPELQGYLSALDDTARQCKGSNYFQNVPASIVYKYSGTLVFALTENIYYFGIYSNDMAPTVYMNFPPHLIPAALKLRQAWRTKHIDKILTLQRMIPHPWELG